MWMVVVAFASGSALGLLLACLLVCSRMRVLLAEIATWKRRAHDAERLMENLLNI